MVLALMLLAGSGFIELAIRGSFPARLRQALAALAALGVLAGSAYLVFERPATWTILLAIFSVYRIVNLLRILQDRHHSGYLQHIAWRSSFWLCLCQVAVAILALGGDKLGLSSRLWLDILLTLQLVTALVIVSSTWRHLRTTMAPEIEGYFADRDLPAVSVLIPARNETDDLEACLRSLTASTYPKLEILVLDDCSQSRQTSDIIRGFAHDGVRFIAGTPPPEQWLAKNYAYEQLSLQANGEILLFCGVDARFSPDSIKSLVQTMINKKKTMLSILPSNALDGKNHWPAFLVQPCRYAWELSLPRRLLVRPPVLSTCWLIGVGKFQAAGTFSAICRSVSPERYFARYCATHEDGYSFLCSNDQLGVSSNKAINEQRATAIRTRYPQLHRQIEKAALLSITELTALLLPFVLLVVGLVQEDWTTSLLSLVTSCLLILFYSRVVSLTFRRFLLRSLYLEPIAAIYDVGLLNYSLWKYEFGEVIWKDRNICIPVMRVVPNLPRLP